MKQKRTNVVGWRVFVLALSGFVGFAPFSASAVDAAKGERMSSPHTVAWMKHAKDGQWIEFEGRIVRRVAGDRYEFSDGTGTVIAEIDDDLASASSLAPGTLLRIGGEVDIDPDEVELDVKWVEILR